MAAERASGGSGQLTAKRRSDFFRSIMVLLVAFGVSVFITSKAKLKKRWIAARRFSRWTHPSHTTLGAHLNTLGAVPLTLPPVPVWALAGTLR